MKVFNNIFIIFTYYLTHLLEVCVYLIFDENIIVFKNYKFNLNMKVFMYLFNV